ncbi:ATP-binding cassette transporter snq2 [Coemansia sp. RSA 1822]|nr:ATP-binding cassette transporter snq2 [Coemansia sp. RSA 1822]
MVAAVSGRLVTYKQKSLSMFHPGVLALVQTVADMVPNLITIVLFSLIIYEAAGLAQTAGQFFAFLLFLFSGCLCLTAMFRLIDFAAVIGYWLVFVIAMAVVMEFVKFGNTGYTIRVHKRRKPKVTLVTEDQVAAIKETLTFSELPTDEQLLAGTTFTWKDLNYTVPVKGESRQLLDNVAGFIKPGQMTAPMGNE